MLQRFVELSEDVTLALLKFPKALFFTKEICGKHYVTGSKIIPLMNCLKEKIEKLSIDLTSPMTLKLL